MARQSHDRPLTVCRALLLAPHVTPTPLRPRPAQGACHRPRLTDTETKERVPRPGFDSGQCVPCRPSGRRTKERQTAPPPAPAASRDARVSLTRAPGALTKATRRHFQDATDAGKGAGAGELLGKRRVCLTAGSPRRLQNSGLASHGDGRRRLRRATGGHVPAASLLLQLGFH